MIADREAGDVLAQRLDHPGALVAEDHRPAARAERAVGEVQVGVADAGGRDPDQHLAGTRSFEQHPLGADRLARLAQHAGAHLDRLGSAGAALGERLVPVIARA